MRILCTADWHLRLDVPESRIDDFIEIQERVLEEITDLYRREECDLCLIAGDIFHKARPDRASELEILAYKYMSKMNTKFIAGNHCLLYHKIENLYKGSLGVLASLENPQFLKEPFWIDGDKSTIFPFSFGQEIENYDSWSSYGIAVIHKYCEPESLPEYIKDGITAKHLLETTNYRCIVIGDNHHGFVYEKEGRFVINPGCITRQTIDMKDYKPRVYIYDTNKNTVDGVELPDNDCTAFTDQINEVKEIEERNSRIQEMIQRLSKEFELELDFEKNLDVFCKENEINPKIVEKIHIALTGGIK